MNATQRTLSMPSSCGAWSISPWILVNAGEVHAAAEHQLLCHSPLETMMPLLHIAVFVAMPGLRLLALQAVETHQALVTIRELNRIAHVVDCRRKPVRSEER